MFDAPQKAPFKSLIVAIPADHSVVPHRIAEWVPAGRSGQVDVIVACAGQPADLAAIHASLRTAEFLIAPAGTSAADLRALAFAQAAGDIVTLVSAVPASADARDMLPVRGALPLSVVVPVRDGGAVLGEVLQAIRASDLPRASYELIVVDDASTDGSATLATQFADRLIRLGGRPRGAAYARNRGVEQSRGDVIAFVDADVRIAPGTLAALLQVLAQDAGVAAVAASNDGTAPVPGVATEYWNLIEQHGAQSYGGYGAHFTASCAVIRRDVFLNVGMYNEWIFRDGSVEDLELALRIQKAGHRVQLSRTVQVTHLRRYTARAVLREVWRCSTLLVRSVGFSATRQTARGHVVHTLTGDLAYALSGGAVLVVAGAASFGVTWALPVAIALSLLLLANATMYAFFARRRGLLFTIAVAPLHWAAQLVGAGGLCVGMLLRHLIGDPAPDPTTQAFAEVGVRMWPPVPRR